MENERMTNELEEMTNEEYRIELQKTFESVDNNRLLRFIYVYVNEIVKNLSRDYNSN